MQQIKFHPKIWTHVKKMYEHYYPNNFKDVLICLLGIEEKDANLSIFSKLNLEAGLIVIKDILENYDVKNPDNWNYFGDYVSSWRPLLIEYLRDNGITYNENEKNFSLTSGEPILIVPLGQLSNLIDQDFNNVFYNELRDEINKAYQMRLFTSVMLLSRKLFENLIIEILRMKYPPNIPGNLEIYYLVKDQKFQNFTILLMNIEERKSEFTVDEHLINEIISLIKPFRKGANANAHSIIIVSDEKDISKFDIPRISALLLRLYSNN
jgi:hypothetical protein